jgi:hypothetical protein
MNAPAYDPRHVLIAALAVSHAAALLVGYWIRDRFFQRTKNDQ